MRPAAGCPMLVAMSRRTVRVNLELQVVEDSLTGSARSGTGERRRFSGWLGLLGALDELVDGNPVRAGEHGRAGQEVASAFGALIHRPSGTGRTFRRPEGLYTLLVTGAESGGSYAALEALVPPGSGSPPHTHRDEDVTLYLAEGQGSFRLGERTVTVRAGDFVNVPRGSLHGYRNDGPAPLRMLLTFAPAGIETRFEEGDPWTSESEG
jgi:quercetin dioxygenase-like cupin family protein